MQDPLPYLVVRVVTVGVVPISTCAPTSSASGPPSPHPPPGWFGVPGCAVLLDTVGCLSEPLQFARSASVTRELACRPALRGMLARRAARVRLCPSRLLFPELGAFLGEACSGRRAIGLACRARRGLPREPRAAAALGGSCGLRALCAHYCAHVVMCPSA